MFERLIASDVAAGESPTRLEQVAQIYLEIAAMDTHELETVDAAGGQLYHEAHRLSVEGLRERGMVEEVTTAMERRRQAHGRA